MLNKMIKVSTFFFLPCSKPGWAAKTEISSLPHLAHTIANTRAIQSVIFTFLPRSWTIWWTTADLQSKKKIFIQGWCFQFICWSIAAMMDGSYSNHTLKAIDFLHGGQDRSDVCSQQWQVQIGYRHCNGQNIALCKQCTAAALVETECWMWNHLPWLTSVFGVNNLIIDKMWNMHRASNITSWTDNFLTPL